MYKDCDTHRFAVKLTGADADQYTEKDKLLSATCQLLGCGTEQVDINGGCLIVRVRGEDLQLLAMTEQELRLGGRITEVELVE